MKVRFSFARTLVPAALFSLLSIVLLSSLPVHTPKHVVSSLDPVTFTLALPGRDSGKPDSDDDLVSHTGDSIVIPFEPPTAAGIDYPTPIRGRVFAASQPRAPPLS